MEIDERLRRMMAMGVDVVGQAKAAGMPELAGAVEADVARQEREMSERRERELAAYRRGRADERAAVVAWLRSLDRLELAKHIDQCAHTDEE